MKTLACLAAAALLMGPAFAASNSCLMASTVSGFKNATDKSVVISSGRNDFLVETTGSCIGLRDTLDLGVKAATSCLSAGDSLIFRDNTSNMPQRCMISSVTLVEKPKAEPEPAPAN